MFDINFKKMSYNIMWRRVPLFCVSSFSVHNSNLVCECNSKEIPFKNETTFHSLNDLEFKRFKDERIIHVYGSIDKELAVIIKDSLEQLDSENNLPIKLIINSSGGETSQGLSICDKMNKVKSEVHTQCDGECGSIASLILANGTEGKRTITPNSTVYIHEPYTSFGEGSSFTIFELNGTLKSLKIQIEKILNILMKVTGKSSSEIEELMKNNITLTSEESVKNKIVDSIVK